MKHFILAALALVATSPAVPGIAGTVTMAQSLDGIAFLTGTWTNGSGVVADTGGTSRGSSVITPEAGGSVLLRKDHTELFDASGTATGSFDQLMMIYVEGGAIHADYSDGTHVIHYTSAAVDPGRSVAFLTSSVPGVPSYRLTYELATPKTLSIRFEIEPPGQSAFHLIASGTLARSS